MSAQTRPLDVKTAKLIVETARDAIKEFGQTNQAKKVELQEIIEKAEDVLPPATVDELRKKYEGKVFRTIHPKGPRLRKFFYLMVALLVLLTPAAVYLRQVYKGTGGETYKPPTPTPTRPAETPPVVVHTPTTTQTRAASEPNPAPSTTSSPSPPATRESTPPDDPNFATAGPPVSNSLKQWANLRYQVNWRITSVQPLAKATRLYIEVINTHERNESYFYSFADFPLVVIDGDGGYHEMLQVGESPEDVRVSNKRWYLQAGRRIQVAVDFAPLRAGKSTGHVIYEKQNSADPAKFSILR